MSDTITATSFLEKLRTATHDAHIALEELPVSKSILKTDVTNEEYANYLSLMRDVVKDAEENIFPSLKQYVSDIESRNKTHLIEADLKTLGNNTTSTAKPLSQGVDNISPAFAMGILYVVEGSALGGRVILKNITGVLGYTGENGAAYFAGYGNLTGSTWKAFVQNLVSFEENHTAGDEIIKGANYAFNAINRHFQGTN